MELRRARAAEGGGGSRSALGPVIGLPFGKEKLEGVGGGVEGQTDRWRLTD